MDREAWHTAAYGVAKSQTWLSDWTELRRKQSKNRGVNSPDSALGMHQTLQGWIPCWGQVSGLTEEEGVMGWREGPTKSLEFRIQYRVLEGFPGGLVKNLPANAGDRGNAGLIPGSGRSPGEGNGKPLQYSCLENSIGQRSLAGHSLSSLTRNQTPSPALEGRFLTTGPLRKSCVC